MSARPTFSRARRYQVVSLTALRRKIIANIQDNEILNMSPTNKQERETKTELFIKRGGRG